MAEKLASEPGRALHKLRQQTVEPVFGVIKAVLGFTGFSLRGRDKVPGEWPLLALAYNCKRLHKLKLATAGQLPFWPRHSPRGPAPAQDMSNVTRNPDPTAPAEPPSAGRRGTAQPLGPKIQASSPTGY